MSGAILKSVLEEVTQEYAGQSFKKQSVKNALKNRGVKDIELEQSGANAFIDNYEGEKVAIDDLRNLLADRPDNIEGQNFIRPNHYGDYSAPYADIREKEFIDPSERYISQQEARDGIVHKKGKYNVKVYTKNIPHSERNHFDLKNYYSHSRYTDVPGEGRMVHELQSDVHQTARTIGQSRTLSDEEMAYIDELDQDYVYEAAKDFGHLIIGKADFDVFEDIIDNYYGQIMDLFDTEASRLEGDSGARLIASALNMSDENAKSIQEDLIKRNKAYSEKLDEIVKNAEGPLEFKQEPQYLNSTINKLLVDSVNEGQKTVQVRIAPDKNLMRSEGIQKWYETDVVNTLKKTAKKIGAKAEMTKDGYMKLELPDNFKLPLYSAAGLAVLSTGSNTAEAKELKTQDWDKVQQALDAGYSQEEIDAYLGGSSNNEVDPKVQQALDAGYTQEEIDQYLAEKQKPTEPPKPDKYQREAQMIFGGLEKTPQTQADKAMDLADQYRNIYGKYSTMGKQVLGVVNAEAGIAARQEIKSLNAGISDMLNKHGMQTFLDPDTGALMMNTPEGMPIEVDSSIINDFWNSKSEITGAVAGGIAGAKLGAKAPARVKPYAVTAGIVAGSATGAAIGKAADLTINAYQLQEDLTAKLYQQQMIEAGVFDIIATTIGAGLFKVGAAGWKQLGQAYDFLIAGNSQGAYKALKENMLLTDEQVQEIVTGWEAHTGKTAPGKNFEQKAIGVIGTTQQGAESFVHYAASKDPKAAAQVMKDIDQRAKEVINFADTITDPNVGKEMIEGLEVYTKDVKDFYGQVKQVGKDAVDGTDFRFDYEKLALEPIVKNIEKGLTDPRIQERFLLHANRIRMASQDRTFGGLLELRQAVNDFKYSTKIKNKKDKDAIDKVINKIDSQIGKAAVEYIPNGKQWLNNWSSAKSEYTKMKKLEQNALYKYLMKGPSEENIQGSLTKYIDRLDGQFLEVVEKLPPKTKAKAEGAIVRRHIDRYTLGYETDAQALHFPMIANSLNSVKFTTPEAKYVVDTINEMAKIFRNDPNLSKVSGNIAVPKFQSYLTIDPVMRLKYEVASGVFNAMKTKLPTKESNNVALLRQMEKVLENPRHVSSVDKFISGLPKESQEEMRSLVKELQIQNVKTPTKQPEKIKIYKQTSSGKAQVSDGALGKGTYYVDKIKKPNSANTVIREDIDPSRLATTTDISGIVGKEIDVKDIRKMPEIQSKLVEKGFLGIQHEGKYMLFTDQTLGGMKPVTLSDETVKALAE